MQKLAINSFLVGNTSLIHRSEYDAHNELRTRFSISEDDLRASKQLGERLTQAMTTGAKSTPTQRLLAAFPLTSPEGLALMRMTEALLRIPDSANAAQLLCDELSSAQWVPRSQDPIAVLAALTLRAGKRMLRTHAGTPRGLMAPLAAKMARWGVHQIGGQFVYAQTISAAVQKAQTNSDALLGYSFDMLGEQALNAADVQRFEAAYAQAIETLGPLRSGGKGDVQLSIKLSALHPRYEPLKRERVLNELVPRVDALIQRARSFDLPVCIDAEEAERLELSLNVFSELSARVKGWNGLGLAVQAYQLRAPQVIDAVIAMAKRDDRRVPVRLVKGAYWDSEIKHAQSQGVASYAVFTRKEHTDLSYLACAAQMMSAREQIAPAFATHNANSFAAILQMAEQFGMGTDYEFQCLHGMGEPLIQAAREMNLLKVPMRLYAPVGAFDALLPYLVRRLLENGANTSFIAKLASDDASSTSSQSIALPSDIFPGRKNSAGVDWGSDLQVKHLIQANESQVDAADKRILSTGYYNLRANIAGKISNTSSSITIISDDAEVIAKRMQQLQSGAASWAALPAELRAARVCAWGDAMERELASLSHIIVLEAGKTWPNAVSDVREAIDFCRYYSCLAAQDARPAAQDAQLAVQAKAEPLGIVATISPWNFPLAIFTGQVAASLVAGNVVIAKPAEQTPHIATLAVQLAYEAGIPAEALQLAIGDGKVGAQLVADERVRGVMFTGSLQVAKLIERTLHQRSGEAEIPFIAETSGLNAMVVDSTALMDQAVKDVVDSAFDSAGQRCSALRLLWLQEEIADRFIAALKGAMVELKLGDASSLDTDIGPVIDAEALSRLQAQVQRLDAEAQLIARVPLPQAERRAEDAQRLPFFSPCAYEIQNLKLVQEETFGPILHIHRYKRSDLQQVVAQTAALGYALTFGVHTRLTSTIDSLSNSAPAGNVYVNRNMIGAVVGSQPFGGGRKSGTGPKAGGPWALRRLQRADDNHAGIGMLAGMHQLPLPGVTGERNTWSIEPRGKRYACAGPTAADVKAQLECLAARGLPGVDVSQDLKLLSNADIGAVLRAGWDSGFAAQVAVLREDILPIIAAERSSTNYATWRLYEERVVSNNIAAAGGDVALLTQ